MKKVYIDRILSVLILMAWMVLIFGFSSQNASDSVSVSTGVTAKIARLLTPNFDEMSPLAQAEVIEAFHHFVRKTAHFVEYAILGLLAVNALRTYRVNKALRFILPVAICLVYAITDETHQYFVPERSAQISDVLLDTLGGTVGVVAMLTLLWLVKIIKRKKTARVICTSTVKTDNRKNRPPMVE